MCERRYTEDVIAELQRIAKDCQRAQARPKRRRYPPKGSPAHRKGRRIKSLERSA